MMHEIWIAVALGLSAIPLAIWLRRKLREQASERLSRLLREVPEELGRIEGLLSPFVENDIYLPKRERRPLVTECDRIRTKSLPKIDRLVKRVGDEAARLRADSIRELDQKLEGILNQHNERYVKREVEKNAQLLLEELRLDEAQRQAVVRDDVANLVIGGAGSGKTRVLTGRVRYLVQRGAAPEHILAVTFTNKARDEMRERLEKAGIPVATDTTQGLTISTLHALGKRTVQASQAEPLSVADERWADSLVASALRDARKGGDSQLAGLYANAVVNFHRNEDERAPELEADKTYRTLRGEHVRSIGERIIADFLYTHNVPYRYEARAAWAMVGSRDAYHPDFHLPGIDAHIEYWGVDHQNNVPTWMGSSEAYRAGMEWKRQQFHRSGKTLIECYDYERREGTLESCLQDRLAAAGVVLRLLSPGQLEEASKDMKYIGSIVERRLGAFLSNARSLRRSPEDILQRLKGTTPRVEHFGRLGAAVLERYESQLKAEGRIDFADMLYRAADVVEAGRSPLPQFDHILVDEFQDTSTAMARFIKTLVHQNGSHLFAVGDDWQAIYGFAGGDVDYIVNFEDHFGPASVTMVSTNYRSPAIVVEAGAALIARNQNQVAKDILIASRERGEAWVHEARDDDGALVQETLRLVKQELTMHAPEDILVLSRTGHILEDLWRACREANIPAADPKREGAPGVRILTAHKSKGLERAVVIIVNASDHLLGFPSKVENPDVLGPVRMNAGNDEAEERRLFYVALTRAMGRLHLVAREGLPSPYIAEIEGRVDGGGARNRTADVPVGRRFAGNFTVERLFPVSERQAQARIRQVGELRTPTERLRFTSWLPFNLEEGATYSLRGVLKDRPYRDTQKVKLDRSTHVERLSRVSSRTPSNGRRELRPRPPGTHRPRPLDRFT